MDVHVVNLSTSGVDLVFVTRELTIDPSVKGHLSSVVERFTRECDDRATITVQIWICN